MTKLNTPLTTNWLTKPPHSKDSVFDIVDNGSTLIARGTIDEEIDLLNVQELIRRANAYDELIDKIKHFVDTSECFCADYVVVKGPCDFCEMKQLLNKLTNEER